MLIRSFYILFLFFLTIIPLLYALPILPDLQGFGTLTEAGRGGEIFHVTNLNSAGEGSLKFCVDQNQPRICVFDVSGTIEITDHLKIRNPNLIIAGQTAPSPGITIKGGGIVVQASDVLVQHIRVRLGDNPIGPEYGDRDTFKIGKNYDHIQNIIVDHVSGSWSIDESFSTSSFNGSVSNVTVRNSIFAESLWDSFHPEGTHSMGAFISRNTHNLLFEKNVLAFNKGRNPLVKDNASNIVLANNLIFHPGFGQKEKIYFGSDSTLNPIKVSVLNNRIIPQTDEINSNSIYAEEGSAENLEVYLNENIGPLYSPVDQWTLYSGGRNSEEIKVDSSPIDISDFSFISTSDVFNHLMSNSGARPLDRDTIDSRIYENILEDTGQIIDSQDEVGGWDIQPMRYRNVFIPENPFLDEDLDGYTNIEEVLFEYSLWVEDNIFSSPYYNYLNDSKKLYLNVLVDDFQVTNKVPLDIFENLNHISINNSSNISFLYDSESLYILGAINDEDLSYEEDSNISDGFNVVFDLFGGETLSLDFYINNFTDIALPGMDSSYFLQGTSNENNDFDTGYEFKIEIPYEDIGIDFSTIETIGAEVTLYNYDSNLDLTKYSWLGKDMSELTNLTGFGALEKTIDTVSIEIEDVTPPQIIDSYVIRDNELQKAELTILTDELSNCRYDFSSTSNYVDKNNSFSTQDNLLHSTEFTYIIDTPISLYISCIDLSPQINYLENYKINYTFTNTSQTQNNDDSSEEKGSASLASASEVSIVLTSNFENNQSIFRFNEENIFFRNQIGINPGFCIPNYVYSYWSKCENNIQHRFVDDINQCVKSQFEKRLCKLGKSEDSIEKLNIRSLDLIKSTTENFYLVSLQDSYNSRFKTKKRLDENNEGLVIIYDESSGYEYLGILLFEDTSSQYHYQLEKIDENNLNRLEKAGILGGPIQRFLYNFRYGITILTILLVSLVSYFFIKRRK